VLPPDTREAMAMNAVTQDWPACLCAYLQRLKAESFSGQVQLTVNFNQGGITKVTALKRVDLFTELASLIERRTER
jgi:hypothetical protein